MARGRIGIDEYSAWALPATRPRHIWSYDFVSVRSKHGAPIRVLNVVDEFTRVALGSRVARSIGAADVVKHLEKLFDQHGPGSRQMSAFRLVGSGSGR